MTGDASRRDCAPETHTSSTSVMEHFTSIHSNRDTDRVSTCLMTYTHDIHTRHTHTTYTHNIHTQHTHTQHTCTHTNTLTQTHTHTQNGGKKVSTPSHKDTARLSASAPRGCPLYRGVISKSSSTTAPRPL